jgi:hypothetical protein
VPGYDGRVFAVDTTGTVAISFHAHTQLPLLARQTGLQPDQISMVDSGSRLDEPSLAFGSAAPNAAARFPNAKVWSGHSSSREGLSALERLRHPAWGDWQNASVVGYEKAQRLDLVRLDARGKVTQLTTALERAGFGFKSVAQGADGLYVLTSGKTGGDEIFRVAVH